MSWRTVREMVRSRRYWGIDRGIDLVKFLQHNGFVVLKGRGKGSHVWMAKVIDDKPVGFSVPTGAIKGKFLKRILEQAEIIH